MDRNNRFIEDVRVSTNKHLHKIGRMIIPRKYSDIKSLKGMLYLSAENNDVLNIDTLVCDDVNELIKMFEDIEKSEGDEYYIKSILKDRFRE
jgi:hypothetical protein